MFAVGFRVLGEHLTTGEIRVLSGVDGRKHVLDGEGGSSCRTLASLAVEHATKGETVKTKFCQGRSYKFQQK